MTDLKTRAVLNKKFGKFQKRIEGVYGFMGDGNGNVDATRQPYIYVRQPDNTVIEVYNKRIQPQDGLPILCGYDPLEPFLFQVLSVWTTSLYNPETVSPSNVLAKHGYRHQWGIGDDVVFVDKRQYLPARVGASSAGGLSIDIYSDVIYINGGWTVLAPQTIDLTSYQPSTAGKSKIVLLTYSIAGAITKTPSAELTYNSELITNVPAIPTGEIGLAAVRLYTGQTVIRDGYINRDIMDCRTWLSPSSVIGPAVLGNGASQYQTIITGATPFVPVYSGFLLDGTTGGKTVFGVTSGKTLTLTSVDNYNLTVPATGTVALLNQANSFTLINPLTTIAESWIGPSSTAGVYFKGGLVGIGSITPQHKLSIVYATNPYIDISTDGTTTTAKTLTFGFDTTNNCGRIQALDYTNGVLSLTLQNVGGKVGIGTIPLQTLHIDTLANGYNQGIPATSGTTQNGILRLSPGTVSYGESFDFGMNINPSYAWIQADNRASLGICYNLALNPNGGNVGIGMTAPTAKLHIVGAADTQQLIVKSNATQTANLQEWQKSDATVLVSINGIGVIFPLQAATASAPAYVKGGIYFDTTLNKLRVGGVTAWETITSV